MGKLFIFVCNYLQMIINNCKRLLVAYIYKLAEIFINITLNKKTRNMWESIKQFFIDNSSSIIVSLIIGAIFFVLGPLGLWFSGKKVKREKINKAKSELLDLIESMLVNNEKITISKLITLFRAVERQNGNNLGLDSDLNNILEDLTLRFAKSKHLSSEQKDSYIEKIDALINSIKSEESRNLKDNNQREIPKSLKSIITELKLETESANGDSKKMIDKIQQLEDKLKGKNDPMISMIRILYERKYFRWVMVIYVIIVLIILLAKELKYFG